MLETDAELKAAFDFTLPQGKLPGAGNGAEDFELRFNCRACAAQWDVDIKPDGSILPGERNALLAHALAHTRGSRMRRVAKGQ